MLQLVRYLTHDTNLPDILPIILERTSESYLQSHLLFQTYFESFQFTKNVSFIHHLSQLAFLTTWKLDDSAFSNSGMLRNDLWVPYDLILCERDSC